MNSGYTALIIIWFFILLIWLGSFDSFLKMNALNKKWIVLYLSISLVGIGFSLDLPDHGSVSFVSFLLPLFSGLHYWARQDDSNRLNILAASFLIGTSLFLLRLLLQLDPVLMVVNENYIEVVMISFLIMIAARGFFQQYILLVFGLTCSEICWQYYLWEKTGFYQLGSFHFSDLWWLTFAMFSLFRIVLAKRKGLFVWRRKRAEIT